MQALLLGGLLVVATLVAYRPAMSGGFVWDDDVYVTTNVLLADPDGLRRIWFSLDSPSQYFPMVYSSFRLEYALWGLDPRGYHLTNIVLHAINALLLWRVLARLGLRGAWLAAAIFALHPVHVESVAWVTERKNVLTLFFSLGSALAWLRFVEPRDEPPRRVRDYLTSLGLHLLALLSKTTACTVPAGYMLFLWLRGHRLDRRRWLQITPFLLLGLAGGLLSIWWEEVQQGTSAESLGIAPAERVLIAGRALWFYLGRLLWPSDLAFVYPRWEIDASDPVQWLWVVAAVAAAGAGWYWREVAGRGPAAALAFFVASLSPLVGFFSLYTFHYTFVMDHYLYVASIGPIALFAEAAQRGVDRLQARAGERSARSVWFVAVACAALLLATLGGLTNLQCRIYRSPETLWRDTLAKNPESWMVLNNLGEELRRSGRVDEAVPYLREALVHKPDFAGALHNLALILHDQGALDEALALQRRAVEADPGQAQVRTHLAVLLVASGQRDEALVHLRRAVEIDPDYGSAHQLLGKLYAELGRDEEAAHHRHLHWKSLERRASYYRVR